MHSYRENTAQQDQSGDLYAATSTRPKFGIKDLVLNLWRALPLMLLVFIPMLVGCLFLVMQLPQKFTAYSRIQVSLGREYVYEPLIGDAGKGATLESEAVVLAEVEKVYSPTIARRVLDRFELGDLYPELAEAVAEADTTEDREKAQAAALKALESGFSAGAAPKSPVIRIAFTHEDAKTSARVVNAFVEEFLAYRFELTTDSTLDSVRKQRFEFDDSLSLAEDDLRRFLIKHRIGDFEAERTALGERHAAISNEIFMVEAGKEEGEARLRVLEGELERTPPEVDLYVETTGDEQLLNLQIEREQLLSRYRADSQPVREVEARISNLRQLLQSSAGGVRRRGQNPAFVELEGVVSVQRAELDALRSRSNELKRQLADVEARQMQMVDILPEYQRLIRNRSVLESSVKTLSEREQTRRAETQLSEDSASLTVLEPAYTPTVGSSMKLVAAFASLLFCGFTALMVGLAYALTRKGLAMRSSVEKTLSLPVIGQAPIRRA